MLPTQLNTNEVKNAAGTEVEFVRLGPIEGRPLSVEFSKSGELPAYPIRLFASHEFIGEGRSRRRRTVTGVNYTVSGAHLVDATIATIQKSYTVTDTPIGNLASMAAPQDAMAFLISMLASRGVDATIKYDGTGCFAEVHLGGNL